MEHTNLQVALFESLHRLGHAHMTDFGDLTKVEFFSLSILCKHRTAHPERKGMYVSELAARLHCSSPAASRTLRHLEEKALVTRVVDTTDRRNTFVLPTDRGTQTVQEVWTRLHTLASRVTEQMGQENLITLIELLNQLADITLAEQKENHSC